MPKVYHREGERAGPRERLFVLDARIRRGDYPSYTKLSKHCGVSAKSIQRDLEYMRDFMYAPLEYDSARKGWHYADTTFSLPAQFGSKHDLQALLVLGQAISQYASTPLGANMKEAFERVLALYKNEETASLKGLSSRIRFARLPGAPISDAVWKAIVTALQFDQRIDLDYAKGGREPIVTRRFDPYGLIVRDRDWFLYGYCHLRKAPLTLSVPFIKRAALLDEYFDLPKGFDLESYIRSGFQGLRADGKKEHKIVLRFAKEVADLVAVRPIAYDQKVEREKSGQLKISFKASALFQVEREIFYWGDKVEVLEPDELRREIKAIGERIVSRHS